MNRERTDAIIQYALAVAAEQDGFDARELGPIHLIKYVYLADLAHAERHDGETFTGADWRFIHFGPWDAGVCDRIEPAAGAMEAVWREIALADGEQRTRRYKASEDSPEEDELRRKLPLEVALAVKGAVRKFGQDTAELLHHVYRTPPMLRARPRDRLQFTTPAREQPESYEPTPLSAKQMKKRRELVTKFRSELAARVAPKTGAKVRPEPRYDEVYVEGMVELEAAAGALPSEGVLEIGDGIWDTRGEPGDAH